MVDNAFPHEGQRSLDHNARIGASLPIVHRPLRFLSISLTRLPPLYRIDAQPPIRSELSALRQISH